MSPFQCVSRLLAVSTLILTLATSGCATKRPSHVFVVSFDGGKPAVMKESHMPVLNQMVKEGAHTWEAQTILPSITLVSHTSMLSGLTPTKHGVFWNDWDPKRGVLNGLPTVFTIAKDRGLTTGIFAGKEKFKHLNADGKIDKFDIPAYEAKKVAAVAAEFIVSHKPNMCFVHFADSDGTGHQFGWGSEQQKKAFADEDEALKTLMDAMKKAGIAKRSVIIMSADHGGINKGHGGATPEEMTIPWLIWGKGVKRGYTITDKVTTYDTAATALWLLDIEVPSNWDGKPIKSAFTLK